ncbi:hypothetical protein [Drosophila suzukii associated hytrosavirus 1]|nr:hypothetical protein [Drosophila suzukii associated hytrosavirus 1]
MFSLTWLQEILTYIKTNSFGLPAIRVLEYDGATFGIIEPYGYYVVNYNSEIYLMRDANTSIKFYVQNDTVVTAIVHTGHVSIGYIDALFVNPPSSSSKITKFILYEDKTPRHHSAIQLINRCLDMRILQIGNI